MSDVLPPVAVCNIYKAVSERTKGLNGSYDSSALVQGIEGQSGDFVPALCLKRVEKNSFPHPVDRLGSDDMIRLPNRDLTDWKHDEDNESCRRRFDGKPSCSLKSE